VAAGLGEGRELVGEEGVAMVWQGPQAVSVDAHARCAWIGSLRGALPPLDEADLSGISGAYSLVWFRGGKVILARARFGGCPLYYARAPDGALVVCSRLAPLVAALERTPSIDRRRLAAVILTSTLVDLDRTVYEGVSRVSSGEALVVTDAGLQRMPRRPLPSPPDIRTPHEASEELKARLFRVVGRVVDEVPRVAVLAGGGIDSSAILAAAVAIARGAPARDVVALTMHVGGIGDDRPYMRELSRALGIEPVRLGPEELAVPGPPALAIDGAPFPWPTGDAIITLMRRARSLGAGTILTGIHGDDVFGGDLRTFAALARAGHPVRGLSAALSLKGTWLSSAAARAYAFFLRPMISSVAAPAWRPLRRRRLRATAPLWAGPVLRQVHREHAEVLLDAEVDTTEDILSGRARHRLLDSPPYHVDQSDNAGQLEALTGCRRVDVLLDEEVADFAASLSAPLLFCGGFHRGLLRAAMKGLVPDGVRFRPDKASATVLVRALYSAPGRAEVIEPLGSMRALGELGLVEPKRFSEAFRDVRKLLDSPTGWMQVWPAIAAEGFARRILDGGDWPAERPPS
jgi:asparagine synthetase B (glutamine-hydrolysing)